MIRESLSARQLFTLAFLEVELEDAEFFEGVIGPQVLRHGVIHRCGSFLNSERIYGEPRGEARRFRVVRLADLMLARTAENGGAA